jgi:hypothetical protein
MGLLLGEMFDFESLAVEYRMVIRSRANSSSVSSCADPYTAESSRGEHQPS